MKYTAIIDNYLDGRLEGEELINFEDELLINPKMAFWVERYRQLNNYMFEESGKLKSRNKILSYSDAEDLNYIESEDLIKSVESFNLLKNQTGSKEILELKKQLKTIHNQYIMNNNFALRKNRSIWLGLAAAVVFLIVAVGIYLILEKKTYTSNELYQAYYQPYKRNIYNRLTQNDPANLFLQALGKYENGQYKDALVYFEKVPATDVSYTASSFFSGVAFMETHGYEKAINAFKKAEGDTVLFKYTDWYIGLCYLKLNQRENAALYFEKIIKSNGFYKDKAEELLKKM